MSFKRKSLSAAAAAALLLTGCGGAEDADSATSPDATTMATATEPADESPTADSAADSPGADDSSGRSDAGLPPRPARDECVRLDAASGGAYTVYDAGRAVVGQEGQRLVLGDVQAAPGWRVSVDDRDRGEVEIEFRGESGEELDLEVEIDDGRVEAEICADDD